MMTGLGYACPPLEQLPDHVRRNREHWDAMADEWVERGRRSWASNEISCWAGGQRST